MTNNGGPAFPMPGMTGLPNGDIIYPYEGMSLRDYFAAKALSLRYGPRDTTMPFDELSKLCYQLADAMLEARKK